QKESQDFYLLRLGLIHHQCPLDFTNTGISNKQQAILNHIRDLKEEPHTEYEWITRIHNWNTNANLILQAYQCLVPDLYNQQKSLIDKIVQNPVTFLQVSDLHINATTLQKRLHLQGAQISHSLQTCLQAVIHHQCDNTEESLLNYLTHTN
ncbi:MAG: hypothetical protein HUJ58_09685, partial [Erysipelotrichaceae bacterium]|nr:hypothetical protein [Erysipelotrichaceae bacterium]